MHLSINGVSDPAYLSFYSFAYIHLVLHNYYYVTVQVSLHACGGDTVILFSYECRPVTTEVQLIADLMTLCSLRDLIKASSEGQGHLSAL